MIDKRAFISVTITVYRSYVCHSLLHDMTAEGFETPSFTRQQGLFLLQETVGCFHDNGAHNAHVQVLAPYRFYEATTMGLRNAVPRLLFVFPTPRDTHK